MKVVNIIYNPILHSYRVVEGKPDVPGFLNKRGMECRTVKEVLDYFKKFSKPRNICVNIDIRIPNRESKGLEEYILTSNRKANVERLSFDSH